MAITNGYCTLDELKNRLDLAGNESNAVLEQIVEAASRQIDGWCARSFYAETATRVVSASHAYEIVLDRDLISITSIATDDNGDRVFETAWSPTDWETMGDAPFAAIYTAQNGARAFPFGRNRVQIAGVWGYAATVPSPIREATLLLAGRLWKRKDAPFGIAGSADHGELQTLPGMDPDVKQLIQPYRRFGLVGV